MLAPDLAALADKVVKRARRQGYVLAREVREEMNQAGLEENRWKEVIQQAHESLRYRAGRYYYAAPVSNRVKAEQSRQASLQRVVRELIRQHQAAEREDERRGADRIDFVHPVQIRTEDGRDMTLLSRDLSASGIRLISSRSLLGQKLCVRIPHPGPGETSDFRVHILWTCTVGDSLFENGGTFLELANQARE